MMDLFSLGDAEIQEMRKTLEETVNEAIEEAIRKNLYSAGIRLKIDVHIRTENDDKGNVCLVPEYSFKTGYSIGGNIDGGKGKAKGTVGIRMTREGFYESCVMPEQMSMVE